MMRRKLLQCVAAFLLFPSCLAAEQIVVLKTGGTFIGKVSFDGDAVVIGIADGQLRSPISEVVAIATITGGDAIEAGPNAQAQELLMKALEARLLHNEGKEVLGILAEAARLAPDDPRVAFWYASTLADAGQGKAASTIFEQQRDAIAETYPGMADELSARIKQRLEMESLPAELVQRIDKFNAAAEQQPLVADERQLFAVFRVVDQEKRPVEPSVFPG